MEPLLNFLWKYFAGPLVANAQGMEEAAWNGVTSVAGYNIYSTPVFAALAALSVYGFYRFFKRYDIDFTSETVIHSIPFILLGGFLRFIEDSGTLPFEVSILLITPVIYFVIAALYLALMSLALKLKDRFERDMEELLLYIGAAVLVPPLLYTLKLFIDFGARLELFLGTLIISAFLTAVYYFIARETEYDKIGYHLAVFSQLFGGSASMIAVTQGYEQKQLLIQFSTKIFGFPGVLITKTAIAALALYVLKDVEDELTEALAVLVLAVVGLATGLRVLLRMTAGI